MTPSCKRQRGRRISTAWARLTCGHLAGWLLLAACALTPLGPAGAASPEKVSAAASILPLGDFVSRIGGERVQVTVLIPPGASPHVFEPSPAAVAGAAKARVLVYVGAGLDPWVSRLVAQRDPNDPGVVEATAGIPLIADVEPHAHGHHPGKGTAHRHDQGNPHIWLDPVLAQDICRRIAAALMAVDPEHRESYQGNLSRYLAELEALHREIEAAVATFRLKEFVSFHPAFTYFARRYGLTEAGVIEAAPGREPTPGQLRRLVATIRRSGVKAVFAEPQLNPRAAEALAREAGVKVLLLDPLGGRPPYGSDYLRLMRYNLAVMQQAMQ
jgi:zinc transport system substrate-binding protein